MKRFVAYSMYWLSSLTWGAVITCIGIITALLLMLTGHRPHRIGPNFYFKVGQGWGGLNLGPIIIISKNSSNSTLYHECGHGIQNITFGPLMPFIVCIPSVIRYWYREIVVRTGKKSYSDLPDYDSIWFEGSATELGERLFSSN